MNGAGPSNTIPASARAAGPRREPLRTPGSSSGTPSSKRLVLPNVTPVLASTLELPRHLVVEAERLKSDATSDNPITEFQARPLVNSTCFWLLRQGVINKEDSPGVISTAAELLHNIIPLAKLQVPPGKTKALGFETRLSQWFGNYITREKATFALTVSPDEELNTPLRDLLDAGKVKVCGDGELPIQGHSGKSIVGRGRTKVTSPTAPPRIDTVTFNGPVEDEHSTTGSVTGPVTGSVTGSVTELEPAPMSSLTAQQLLQGIADHAGLDVSVGHAKRAVGSNNLPAFDFSNPAIVDPGVPDAVPVRGKRSRNGNPSAAPSSAANPAAPSKSVLLPHPSPSPSPSPHPLAAALAGLFGQRPSRWLWIQVNRGLARVMRFATVQAVSSKPTSSPKDPGEVANARIQSPQHLPQHLPQHRQHTPPSKKVASARQRGQQFLRQQFSKGTCLFFGSTHLTQTGSTARCLDCRNRIGRT